MRCSRFSALLGCLVYSRNQTSSSDLSTTSKRGRGQGGVKGVYSAGSPRTPALQRCRAERRKITPEKWFKLPSDPCSDGSARMGGHPPLYVMGDDAKERLSVCPGRRLCVFLTVCVKGRGRRPLTCSSQIWLSYAEFKSCSRFCPSVNVGIVL